MNMIHLAEELPLRLREGGIRALIWSFIGLLYAMLFVFFVVLADYWGLPMHPYFIAGVFSGTIGALIYSSMRLVVLMAVLIFPVALIYLLFQMSPIDLEKLLLVMTASGGAIGGLYGWLAKGSRIYRADAKTLAGFCSGVLVSLLYLLFSPYTAGWPVEKVIALMCPLTGLLYVKLVPVFIQLYDDLLPPFGDGVLLGCCVAVFIALYTFVMISSIDGSMAGILLRQTQEILNQLPMAVVGGLLSAGAGGFVSGLLLLEWQDL